MAWILVALMLGNAGAMLVMAWGLPPERARLYYAALLLLAVNLVLTLTDQVGTLDVIFLVVEVALAALVIAHRRQYRPVSRDTRA